MTDEQIKQNAEEYAKKIYPYTVGKAAAIRDFIAGAHSRDEEIDYLTYRLNDTTEKLQTAIAERDNLRNPWINVNDQMPEEDIDNKGYSVNVIGLFSDGSVSKCYCSIEEGIWFIEDFTCDKPVHWMPMPELKKRD